jgi:hypothetical protein
MGRHCCPWDFARALNYTTCFRLRFPIMFSPGHSPLTSGHRAKSINMSSRRIYFVRNNSVFAEPPVHVLLRMPRRITRILRTERVFDGGVTHGERKTFQASVRGRVEFCIAQLLRKQSCRDGAKRYPERRAHGEASGVSNCRPRRRLCQGE